MSRVEIALNWVRSSGDAAARTLLDWFDESARDLPWRQERDPYRVLLSELMLQQTQVATVIPYYSRFLSMWPTIDDLAKAQEQDVLKAWEGLGYYSRARHLLATARQVVAMYCGQIPDEEVLLRTLKGVGDYTAGAILSIAYNKPVAAVDGNVVRVLARLACTEWDPSDPRQRREVRQVVEGFMPRHRPGDFNEALMDLGATVCLPKSPHCASCPIEPVCLAHANGQIEAFPRKKIRAASRVEQRICLVFQKGDLYHVSKRANRGLLSGLYEFDWAGNDWAELSQRPDRINLGSRRHVFTHLVWEMQAWLIRLGLDESQMDLDDRGQWVTAEQLAQLPFPTALASWRDQLTGGTVNSPVTGGAVNSPVTGGTVNSPDQVVD